MEKILNKEKLFELLDEVDAGCDEAWLELESRDRYFAAMNKLREYIEEGETMSFNLSNKLRRAES